MNGNTLSQGDQILKAKYLAAQSRRQASKPAKKPRKPRPRRQSTRRNFQASTVIARGLAATLDRVNNPQDGE